VLGAAFPSCRQQHQVQHLKFELRMHYVSVLPCVVAANGWHSECVACEAASINQSMLHL
jgi:hypothetical protein